MVENYNLIEEGLELLAGRSSNRAPIKAHGLLADPCTGDPYEHIALVGAIEGRTQRCVAGLESKNKAISLNGIIAKIRIIADKKRSCRKHALFEPHNTATSKSNELNLWVTKLSPMTQRGIKICHMILMQQRAQQMTQE